MWNGITLVAIKWRSNIAYGLSLASKEVDTSSCVCNIVSWKEQVKVIMCEEGEGDDKVLLC